MRADDQHPQDRHGSRSATHKARKVTTTGLTVAEALLDRGVDARTTTTWSARAARPRSTTAPASTSSAGRRARVTVHASPRRYTTIVRDDTDMYERRVTRDPRRPARQRARDATAIAASERQDRRASASSSASRSAEPVAQIEVHGTKDRPEPTPTPSITRRHGVWDALAQCESGGNWAHQHRQRLLRRPAVQRTAPGSRTAAAPTPRPRTSPAARSRSRSRRRSRPPRWLRRLAGLRGRARR